MIDLLDASVWLPLFAPDHAHHERARRYWETEGSERAAFCRITALAVLRHLTNATIMRHAVLTSEEAWEEYRRWLTLPEVLFLAEPSDLEKHLGKLCRSHDLRPKRWNDAYIAAFALAMSCRVVGFDGGFHAFQDLDFLHLEV